MKHRIFYPFFKSIPIFQKSPVAKRKLILISLDWTRPKDPPLSLGHASLLANLKQKNIAVIEQSYAVNKAEFSSDKVAEFILENAKNDPWHDVAIGAFIWNEPALQSILSKLQQKKFQGRIILGGPQVSYVKNGIEKYYPSADIFIRGYAEEALVQLMSTHEKKPPIIGVHYAGDVDHVLSAKIALNDMPSPYLTNIIAPQRFIRWETQRGCPFRCAFCQHRESDTSQQRRHFEMSRIMAEINWITQHPIIQDIAVLDPIFNSGPNYLSVLEAFYKKNYTGKLALQARMEMVVPEFLDITEKLNQKGQIVLEFGLQSIHKNEQALIDRPNNMKKVEAVLQEVQKRKIPTEISLIFGLPGQTVKSFQQSIDFCKHLKVKTIHAFPLMLLRGTPLYQRKHELKLTESSDVQVDGIDRLQAGIPHVIASDSFSFEDWQKMAEMAAALDDYNQVANAKIVPTKNTDNLWQLGCGN